MDPNNKKDQKNNQNRNRNMRGVVTLIIWALVLTVVFRSVGLYPEGVTYAILLMNAASWLLEHFTPTRLFGAPQRKGGLR